LVAGHGRKPDNLTTTTAVLNEVYRERQAQAKKWGLQDHPDGTDIAYKGLRNHYQMVCDIHHTTGKGTWLDILMEETYEAFTEENETSLRAELVQCAAVTIAWIEAIDRRKP